MNNGKLSVNEIFQPIPEELEAVASQIVDSAFKVHTTLGPGLLESVYEVCLTHELRQRGLKVDCQKQLPVYYEGVLLDAGYRLDMLVDERVIIELKSTDGFHPVQQAQMMTYLKLTGLRLGFILNFNVPVIKQGIRRVVMNPKNGT
jgi:GxxExxY protein